MVTVVLCENVRSILRSASSGVESEQKARSEKLAEFGAEGGQVPPSHVRISREPTIKEAHHFCPYVTRGWHILEESCRAEWREGVWHSG